MPILKMGAVADRALGSGLPFWGSSSKASTELGQEGQCQALVSPLPWGRASQGEARPGAHPLPLMATQTDSRPLQSWRLEASGPSSHTELESLPVGEHVLLPSPEKAHLGLCRHHEAHSPGPALSLEETWSAPKEWLFPGTVTTTALYMGKPNTLSVWFRVKWGAGFRHSPCS